MKYILLFTALFPFCLMAQQLAPLKDTAHAKARKPHLEGYVQAGFTNEFWVLSAPLTNGVTSLSYGGKGGFAGIGFKSKNTGKPLGFGLALDILAYSMDATLKTNELAQLNYAYGRLTPVVYLNLKSNNEFKFSLCATGSLFIPAHANENSYLQFGGRISVRYKAYEMYLAPGFSKSSKAPSTLIMNSNWREQQLNIGLVVYPSSLLQWPAWMSRIRGKDVAPLGK